MEDVLIRLRRVPQYPGIMLCKDAADEIERLRAENARLIATLKLIAANYDASDWQSALVEAVLAADALDLREGGE